MISWTLSLSGSQIRLLQSIGKSPVPKHHGDLMKDGAPHHSFRHYLVHIRALERHGLIKYVSIPSSVFKSGKVSWPTLSARGQLILSMIEEDMAKFIAASAGSRKPRLVKGKRKDKCLQRSS